MYIHVYTLCTRVDYNDNFLTMLAATCLICKSQVRQCRNSSMLYDLRLQGLVQNMMKDPYCGVLP